MLKHIQRLAASCTFEFLQQLGSNKTVKLSAICLIADICSKIDSQLLLSQETCLRTSVYLVKLVKMWKWSPPPTAHMESSKTFPSDLLLYAYIPSTAL